MRIVLDTSAVVAVVLGEPERDAIVRATRGAGLVAPASVPWEVGNALIVAHRRGRIDERQLIDAWALFMEIPIRTVEVSMDAALRIAALTRSYAYDAYMLAAASRAHAPLLTLDHRLRQVAAEVGVEVLEVT
ncbi:MAG TPA: type II toxin-antitoxin system VapC family toxin [Candidatus Polarisedimenticolaceae bacterium]